MHDAIFNMVVESLVAAEEEDVNRTAKIIQFETVSQLAIRGWNDMS